MNDTEKNIGKITKSSTADVPKKKKGGKFFKLVFLLVLAGLIYSQYELYKIKNPNYQIQLQEKKNKNIIERTSKLMVVPEGVPQILFVEDVNQLKAQQPFFKDADNGDAVLVYPNVAIIYSVKNDKIVNVGPVINEKQAPQVVVPQKTEKASTTEEKKQ